MVFESLLSIVFVCDFVFVFSWLTVKTFTDGRLLFWIELWFHVKFKNGNEQISIVSTY